MLRNYLLVATRNLRNQGWYAFLNVFGLSIGIASCLMIALYVFDELRYDTFHTHADHLYRITHHEKISNSEIETPLTVPALAPASSESIAGVKSTVRVYPGGRKVMQIGDETLAQTGFMYVDDSFLQVFSYEVLAGDPATALQKPNSLVLTEKVAKKYFGSREALGKFVQLSDSTSCKVTAVVANPPPYTHLPFDVLASYSSLPPSSDNNWERLELYTYFLLEEGVKAASVEEDLQTLQDRYISTQVAEYSTYEAFQQAGNEYYLSLQPITQIHLYSDLFAEFNPGGDVKTLYVLIAVAAFLLLIACVNFMNLATARYMRRAREVGVRKALGSTRVALIVQFLNESLLMSLFAAVLGVIWALLFLPAFNSLTGKEITYAVFTEGWLIGGLILLMLVVGMLAGSYPAFFLSGFRPTEVLKGGWFVRKGSIVLRNLLVVFQFSVSIGLIICTVVAYQQIAYTQSKDLGFDKEQVMALSYFDLLGDQGTTIKEAIAQQAMVVETSVVSDVIPQTYQMTMFWQRGSDQEYLMNWYTSDYDHLETMGIELLEGRNFSREYGTDTAGVLLNETAVRTLEIENPIGAEISYEDTEIGTYEVLGVVKDFHFRSLHHDIEPMAIFLSETGPNILVRLAPGNVSNALEQVDLVWQQYAPDVPFDYTFLDEEFDRAFRAEQRLSRVFTVFSVLTIIVASLGLLGLGAYSAQQRTKEIGVRKTMGASTGNLILLLSKDFTKLVLLAFGIATPIVYFLMQSWLKQFAFRIEVGMLPFVLAGLGAMLLAWVTVGWLAYRATQANLANVLRLE
ncbi:ABC transporter permease [Tunicatimonas pelagia]|uniref:ABC transporter permease n=1 Tax=Tunicatimonas pelagia TaxID=931531 RepID=UPI002666B8ED|nr:ABC transporter permease [Tunicatimonas pelagia]WKN41045.1 ABC transporter permease [Tunicatimonas pelagia]